MICSSNTNWCPNTHQTLRCFTFQPLKLNQNFAVSAFDPPKKDNSTCFLPGMSHRGQTLHRYQKPSKNSGINRWLHKDGQVLTFGQATNSTRAGAAMSPSLNLYQTCQTSQGRSQQRSLPDLSLWLLLTMSTAGVWKRS